MKVLVAAASKYGSTWEIAKAIAQVLAHNRIYTTVTHIENAPPVSAFDAVVLGSGVYAGRWMKIARDFVDQHADELAIRPVWLFSSGPIGNNKVSEQQAVRIDSLVARTKAKGHRVFGGRLDKKLLNFGERAIWLTVGLNEGDYRNWDDINAWAEDIVLALRDFEEMKQ